ncbi:MAG: hypothetical protein OXC62_17805 [Aestuariivita sp.]|nr:hypothetical protein [Aestuariivita sp.]
MYQDAEGYPFGDIIEEGEELFRAMTFNRLTDNLAGSGVKGGQQTGRTVSPVIAGSCFGIARRHG